MTINAVNGPRTKTLFGATAIAIYATIFLIARTQHATLIHVAATLDLTITTSAAFYFLLVRRGHAGWLSLVTVALIGLRTATFLFPENPSSLKWLAAPLELLVILNIIRKIRRSPDEVDALTRIRTAVSALLPNPRLARMVAAEIAVVYYSFCSWRSRPDPGFSCARSSGYSLFGTLLIFGMVFEGIPLHLLVMHYSRPIAWTLTALDLYGLIWATAILRANHLRSIQLDGETLRIRIGLIWEIDVPRRTIAKVRPYTPADRPDLKAVFLNTPKLLIEFNEPVQAIGLYGNRRSVTKLALSVDSPDDFCTALNV